MSDAIMSLGKCHGIAFSDDEACAFSFYRDVFLWDLKKGKKIISKHVLSNPSKIAVSSLGRSLVIKNTHGVIYKIDAENLSTLGVFEEAKVEGCNPIYLKDKDIIVNADWNGNIYRINLESFKIENLKNIKNSMITQLRNIENGSALAFIVQPKWKESNEESKRPWIAVSDWEIANVKILSFPYSKISYFALASDGSRILICGRKDDSNYYVEYIDLKSDNLLFSSQITINGSGMTCCRVARSFLRDEVFLPIS